MENLEHEEKKKLWDEIKEMLQSEDNTNLSDLLLTLKNRRPISGNHIMLIQMMLFKDFSSANEAFLQTSENFVETANDFMNAAKKSSATALTLAKCMAWLTLGLVLLAGTEIVLRFIN